jgi:hypothetical protein
MAIRDLARKTAAEDIVADDDAACQHVPLNRIVGSIRVR